MKNIFSDSVAAFSQTKQPSVASAEICQLRILAPKDVTDKLIELMESLGLTLSGSGPEVGYPGRHRTYFVVTAARFRQLHILKS